MNNENGRYFTVTDKTGTTIEYEILFTFDSDETKKSYIVFTDNNKDKEGNIITYAATYTKNGEKLELQDIETEQEWALIESILAQIEEKTGEE